ncbi:MAG: hypothetical protein ABJE95_00265 [Byssovorax sp.]
MSGPASSSIHSVAAPVSPSWIGPRNSVHASFPAEAGRLGALGPVLVALGNAVETRAAALATALTEGAAAGATAAEATTAADGSVRRDGSLGLPWHAASAAIAATPIPLLRILLLAASIGRIYRHTMRWLPSRTAGLALLSGALVACSAAPPPVVTPHPKPEVPRVAPPPAPPPIEGLLPSHVIAQLDDETTSPYFARRGEEGLLLYASSGHWLTRPIGADGAPKSKDALDVGLTGDLGLAALEAAGDGYLAVWIENVARSHTIKLLSLDAGGVPKGEPVIITQVSDEVSYVDALANAEGALILWEVPHGDSSDVFVVATAGGKAVSAVSTAAHDVYGWQVVGTERGAAMATVPIEAGDGGTAPKAKGPKKKAAAAVVEDPEPRGSKLGRVFLAEIDAKGKTSAPVIVSPEATAQVDVELVEVGGKYVVAWTDERHIDPCVYTASVDPGGKIATPPHRATTPFGEQALVSLVASPYTPGGAKARHAALAWEDLLRSPRDGRLIHLGVLGSDGTLGKERATLTFAASGPPDLVPDGEGFAAVTLAPSPFAPAAPEGDTGGRPRKKDAPILPQYVRFGPDLSVIGGEPVIAEPFGDHAGVPYLTRTLTCANGACATLASSAGKGAPLAMVALPARKSTVKAAGYRDEDESPPRPVGITALFDGDHLAKVAAADLPGGGSMAAWVTYYLEGASNQASNGKKKAKDEGPFATLGVRPIGPNGLPGKTLILSHKALSIGGVALSPVAGDKQAETAVAWVAREKGESQVFVTKVGADGAKLAQKGVTVLVRKKGKGPMSEASDVAIAADGAGGWVVAWVDTRDGNAEIYVAKVDKSLTKVVPDKRITDAPGDSAEVQIVVKGKEVLLVWSDARKSPEDGSADIYLARLDLATLKKQAPEARIFASELHSRTPQIQAMGSGFLLGWIEDAFGAGKDGKADSPESTAEKGLRLARLDDHGAMIGVPQLIRGENGYAVTSATLGCGPKICRGVLTTAQGESLTLGAFDLTPGSPAGPLKTIAVLTGPVTQDVSPMFSGAAATSLFFADDAVGGSGRVRWMQLGWP